MGMFRNSHFVLHESTNPQNKLLGVQEILRNCVEQSLFELQ